MRQHTHRKKKKGVQSFAPKVYQKKRGEKKETTFQIGQKGGRKHVCKKKRGREKLQSGENTLSGDHTRLRALKRLFAVKKRVKKNAQFLFKKSVYLFISLFCVRLSLKKKKNGNGARYPSRDTIFNFVFLKTLLPFLLRERSMYGPGRSKKMESAGLNRRLPFLNVHTKFFF